MSAERVGLMAVFDLSKFNSSYSQYLRKLGALNSRTVSTARALTQSFVGFGNQLLKIGGILSGVVAVAAGIAAKKLADMVTGAVDKAADLEQGVANIASVLNMTKDEASVLKDVIIDLGIDPRLKVTTFEAADALEKLAKNGIFAGLSVAEVKDVALDAGTAVVMLANATGADFAQAANISSTAMEIFNLEASDMIDIVSNITGVTTNSKLTIQDYEVALRNGGAAVAAFGVSLEDFNTLVALSAEEMGTGQKAGTGLLNFMNRLTPNTKKAEDAMKALGLMTADGTNLFFDSAGEIKSMAEVSHL
ncbi:MAG: phage tail tape measure protein, partial [Chloroflexi bacterium]